MAGAQQTSSNSRATGVQAQDGASAQGSESVQKSSGTAAQSQSSAAGGASGSAGKGEKGVNADTDATTNAVLSGSLDAKRAKPGDPVTAKMSEASSTPDHTSLPKGTKLVGHVTEVKAVGGLKAGRFSRSGSIARFCKDSREIPIQYTVRALAAAESGVEASTDDAMDGGLSGAAMASGGAGVGHNAMGAVGGIGATAGGALGGGIGSVGRVPGGVAGSTGWTLGASSRALKGGAGAVGGIDARGLLTADSQGVFGICPDPAVHSSNQIRVLHPCGNVAHAVEHTPNIDVIAPLHVKHQVRVFLQAPEAQSWKIQLARIARGAGIRMSSNLAIRLFQRINEP
jgi:hypothetical protein